MFCLVREKISIFHNFLFFVYKVFVRPKSHLYKELCVKSTCQLPAAGHSATMSSAAIIILSMQKPWNFWSHKPLLWFSFFLILLFEGTYELAPHFQLKIKLKLFSRRIYFFPRLYFHYHCFPTDEDSIQCLLFRPAVPPQYSVCWIVSQNVTIMWRKSLNFFWIDSE